jgi:hypothetical protein
VVSFDGKTKRLQSSYKCDFKVVGLLLSKFSSVEVAVCFSYAKSMEHLSYFTDSLPPLLCPRLLPFCLIKQLSYLPPVPTTKQLHCLTVSTTLLSIYCMSLFLFPRSQCPTNFHGPTAFCPTSSLSHYPNVIV